MEPGPFFLYGAPKDSKLLAEVVGLDEKLDLRRPSLARNVSSISANILFYSESLKTSMEF